MRKAAALMSQDPPGSWSAGWAPENASGAPYGQPGAGSGQPSAQSPGQPYGQSFAQPPGPAFPPSGQAGAGSAYPGYPPPVQGVPVSDAQGDYGPRGLSDDRVWALLAYLSPIVVSFIGPLVIYLVKMNESRYVRFHAAQSLNLMITSVIYSVGIVIVSIVLAVATHGIGLLAFFVLYLLLGALVLVYLILAAIAANRGELYRIPGWLCLSIVH
jgi:uncharacterized Tic20 family protein